MVSFYFISFQLKNYQSEQGNGEGKKMYEDDKKQRLFKL